MALRQCLIDIVFLLVLLVGIAEARSTTIGFSMKDFGEPHDEKSDSKEVNTTIISCKTTPTRCFLLKQFSFF